MIKGEQSSVCESSNKVAPCVSVIAVCYNHSKFLLDCLNSIRNQTYPNVELIILDDCSTDDSVVVIQEWIKTYKVDCHFVVHTKNQGLCRTLNEALTYATGKYVCIISTDDRWTKDKLEKQVQTMEQLPENVGVLYSNAYHMTIDGEVLSDLFIESVHPTLKGKPEGKLYDILADSNFIPAPSVLIRRQCYEAVGPYDEELSYEDWDMWIRISQQYDFVYSPHITTHYRIVGSSLSHHLFSKKTLQATRSHFHIFRKCCLSPYLSPQQKLRARERLIETLLALSDMKDPKIGRWFRKAFRVRFTPGLVLRYLFSISGVPYQTQQDLFQKVKKYMKGALRR